jgi:hypothetical protein
MIAREKKRRSQRIHAYLLAIDTVSRGYEVLYRVSALRKNLRFRVRMLSSRSVVELPIRFLFQCLPAAHPFIL